MPVNIKPISQIKVRLGIEQNGKVQKFLTNTCYKRMDKYVPKDIGNLRTIVDIKDNSITYESPYAHAQYIGIVNGSTVHSYTTPGTGPYWDKKMVSAEMKQIERELQNFIGR